MRIRRVVLNNFGPHANWDEETEGGVIGVAGPNGSGKSHLLLGVEFGMTGELPGNRKTYIRDNEKKGFVEIWFEQNNTPGRVKRWLQSPKRELEWDGKTYEKAAEVDEILGQILGARKESFKNSSFIRQGELKNVLDGTDTQRRNILVKLLSLGFVDRRRSQLDTKIEQFVANNLDPAVYGRRDQIREQLEEQTLAVKTVQTQLDNMIVYEPDLTAVQEYLNVSSQLKDERENLALAEHQLSTGVNPEDIKAYSQAVKDIIDLEEALDTANSLLQSNTDILNGFIRATVVQEQINKIEGTCNSTQEKLDTVQTEFRNLTDADPADAKQIVERATLFLETNEKWVQLNDKIVDQERVSKMHQEELSNFDGSKLEALSDKATALGQESQRLSVSVKMLEQSLETLKLASGTQCTGDKATCPKCSLKVIPREYLTPEKVAEYEANLQATQKDYADKQAELDAVNNEVTELNNTRLKLEKSAYDSNAELVAMQDTLRLLQLPAGSSVEKVSTLRKNLEQIESCVSRISTLESELRLHKNSLASLYTELASLKVPTDVTIDQLKDKKERSESEVLSIRSDLKKVKEKRDSLHAIYERHRTLSERIKYLKDERLPKLEAAFMGFEPSKNVEALMQKMHTHDFQVVYDTMVEAHQEYLVKRGELDNLKVGLANLQRQVIEIEAKIAKQEKHKKVLEALQELRRLLEADGVLKAYLSYRFKKLHNTVSKNLNLLDANFVIRPCTENLSYEFVRVDDTEGVWKDIGKLSGGQKVKLGVAFLISVQETICKDVNFLVLDEPSTHLDEASVEALRSLFADLVSRMDDGKGQLWIVDHHFSLLSAASTSFRLESTETETE